MCAGLGCGSRSNPAHSRRLVCWSPDRRHVSVHRRNRIRKPSKPNRPAPHFPLRLVRPPITHDSVRVVGGSVTVMLCDGCGREEKVMLSALMFSYAARSQTVPSCSLQVSREKAELLQLRASHRTASSRPQLCFLSENSHFSFPSSCFGRVCPAGGGVMTSGSRKPELILSEDHQEISGDGIGHAGAIGLV